MNQKYERIFLVAVIALLLLTTPRVPAVHAQGVSAATNAIINVAPGAFAYTQAFDYDGSGNCIYVGMARSAGNPSTASAVWSIRKITYSGNNPTLIQWANGTTSETNVWNNRASLSYQ